MKIKLKISINEVSIIHIKKSGKKEKKNKQQQTKQRT